MARRSHCSSKNEMTLLSKISHLLGFRMSVVAVGSGSDPAIATRDVIGSSGCMFDCCDFIKSHLAFELHLFVSETLVG